MEERLENYRLIEEAEYRLKEAEGQATISHADIMARYGLTEDDLNDGVEIE